MTLIETMYYKEKQSLVGFDFNSLDDSIGEEMTEEDYELMNGVRYVDESQAVYHERYKKLTLSQQIRRYNQSHEDPKRWKKLAKYSVQPHQTLTTEKHDLLVSAIETAQDEKVMQLFLKENPFILTTAISPAHHGQICVPKPKLGNQLEPDFFIAGLDSAGYWWYGVELESPQCKMFTKSGEETKELKHAIRQIQDWRAWLKSNITYARDTLGFLHIDADLPCYIFIGRRENEVLEEDKLTERRQQLRASDRHGLFIYHYEWLVDKPRTIIRVEDKS